MAWNLPSTLINASSRSPATTVLPSPGLRSVTSATLISSLMMNCILLPRRYSSDMISPRFQVAIARIDSANAADPRGVELPYSQRLSAWVERLAPDASEPLRLAARAQHICRWESPRDSYPAGRIGYLKWREDLKQFHAEKAGTILR